VAAIRCPGRLHHDIAGSGAADGHPADMRNINQHSAKPAVRPHRIITAHAVKVFSRH